MGKHKYNFHRLFIIDEMISGNMGPTVQSMRDQCEWQMYGRAGFDLLRQKVILSQSG